MGRKITYRTPKLRAPSIATTSSTAAGSNTYPAAARSRRTLNIAAAPATHSASMPSGVFTSSAAGR